MVNSSHLIANQEPHSDGWHYLDSRDEKHKKNYIEWKYFNFTQKDLAGYIIYYVIDPEKNTKFGGGRLLIRIVKDGVSYGLIKKIDMEKVELDLLSASMSMGDAEIVEKSSYIYKIKGKANNLNWNLDYRQRAPTIESFQNLNTCLIRWEKVNWLIKMPRAQVTGDITIDKEVFHVDALGYSDTNWGEMVPFFTKYEWGQYSDANFSLVFGMLYRFSKMKSSYFYLVFGEHVVALENALCEVKRIDWIFDKILGVKVPGKNIFSVKNKEYEIKFSTNLIYHDNLGLKIYPFLPKIVVSEQIVEYEGSVTKNGVTLHEFKGRGFKEWTTRTWKSVPLSF
ncbi:hypothetical protein A3F19_01120 [Candidatus Nomurabacteria bacterium RIFCSPHIGHO2_12_FULL_37_29]|uniref:AttH domain-containing protein n=1 Tax=Candidatus Nomurabacteria bacterium RIFCSPHIGHO2_12_FULL_37_29 TaxID=1801759 RepID=A0A1F6WBT7_9BACT|nr:MAG: hypothetical protein A2727_02460 [Candidatus Nomurabacteria bacterium RIFCSPHIGHO2_01_FULL_37_110]OGI79359.1 MAG: hypothetical protein A3F19_01120 [Candidatus Nomurabacteria bacterium RIFCSPHIGHO2_12_FULL_37_29]OGI85167.1 MAG: hypothetical protein A3A92_02740 [Candidatus Nomurabacteria bacterium RIFCSPLOWO2_01_FULL_37_49]